MRAKLGPIVPPVKATLGHYAAFSTCCLIWGSTFLLIQIGNGLLPAIWAATLRLALASVLLTLLAWASGQHLPRGMALQAAIYYGLFEFGIQFPLLYWAEKSVPSGIAAILYATIPLSTALMARAFGLERLNLRKLLGAVVALLGIAVIFAGQVQDNVPFPPLVALLGATIAAALAAMFLKRVPPQPALATNAVGAGVGAALCYLASVLTGESQVLPHSLAQWFPVIYLTLAGSLGAFTLFTWLLNHWDVTKVAYTAVIAPIVAVLLGAWLHHERIGWSTLVGAALVFSAVTGVLTQKRNRLPFSDREPAPPRLP